MGEHGSPVYPDPELGAGYTREDSPSPQVRGTSRWTKVISLPVLPTNDNGAMRSESHGRFYVSETTHGSNALDSLS
jgi:hypothetical protein